MIDALERSHPVRMASDRESASVCIYLLPPRHNVSPASPVPQAGTFADARWAVVGTTGDLLMPLKRLGEYDDVVQNLETVARYRRVQMTDNPDPRSALRGRIELELLRRTSDGGWQAAPPQRDGGHAIFEENEPLALRITNHHHKALYVALVDLGVSGAVSVVTQGEAIAPGVSWDIGTGGDVVLRFPDGYPFVDSVDHVCEAGAIETLKAFVTESPALFDHLQQTGVRSVSSTDGSTSALGVLLRDAIYGKRTRDASVAAVGREDWTTVSRSFVLIRQTVPAIADGAPVSTSAATLSAPDLPAQMAFSVGQRWPDTRSAG